MVRDAPFGETTQISVVFCVANFQESLQICKFSAFIERSKAKSISALGGFAS